MTRTEYVKLLTQTAATLISSNQFGFMGADNPDTASRAVHGATQIIKVAIESAKSVPWLQGNESFEEVPF
jgi:hypothetical protein